MSFDLFEKYGVENCKIILLENVNALTKDELRAIEGNYIRNMNCVNKYIPDRTRKNGENNIIKKTKNILKIEINYIKKTIKTNF